MKWSTLRVATLAVLAFAAPRIASAQNQNNNPQTAQNEVAFAVLLQLGGTPQSAQEVAESLSERAEAFLCSATTTIPAGSLPDSCATSPACIQKLGETTKSKRLALLTLLTSGGQVRLDVQLFATDTGKRTDRRQAGYKLDAPDALAEAQTKVLTDLFPHGGKPCPSAKDKEEPDGEKEGDKPGIPDPAKVAAEAEKKDASKDTPNGARNLGQAGRTDRSSNRKWLWVGGALATVAVAATVIYFATAEEELPILALPPPP